VHNVHGGNEETGNTGIADLSKLPALLKKNCFQLQEPARIFGIAVPTTVS